jgi:uncharacterized membrane protein
MIEIFIFALIALPIMFVLDFTWIGIIANSFYKEQLGVLYSTNIIWPAAIAFYVIYAVALVYFAVLPAVRAHSWKLGAGRAALFALAAYATYDLTGLATIPNWPVLMTFVDMAWGIVLSVVTTSLVYLIATKLLKK